jgi:hypothetical protein
MDPKAFLEQLVLRILGSEELPTPNPPNQHDPSLPASMFTPRTPTLEEGTYPVKDLPIFNSSYNPMGPNQGPSRRQNIITQEGIANERLQRQIPESLKPPPRFGLLQALQDANYLNESFMQQPPSGMGRGSLRRPAVNRDVSAVRSPISELADKMASGVQRRSSQKDKGGGLVRTPRHRRDNPWWDRPPR